MTTEDKDQKDTHAEPIGGEDLVAMLYGELDAEASEAYSAQLDASDELRGAHDDLQDLRSLFAQMPFESQEPPGRLSAQLLAEAAKAPHVLKARPAASSDGLWARFMAWMQPMVMRPSFAAAASIVVIMGVAGLLYVKKGDELTETRRREAAKVDSSDKSVAAETPAPAAVSAADEVVAGEGSMSEDLGSEAREEADAPRLGGLAESAKDDDKGAVSRKGGGKTSKSAGANSRTLIADTRPEPVPEPKTKNAKPATKSADDYDYGNSGGGRGGGPGGISSGSSQQELSPEADDESPSPPPAPKSSQPPSDSKRLSVREIHNKAISAAKNKNCSLVASLVDQIRERDAAYYRSSVAGDNRLGACTNALNKSQR